MAPVSPKWSTKCHVRSISLPSRSHPTTVKIVEELNKVGSCAEVSGSAPGSARAGLMGLGELYEAANDFLSMASTQQAISCNGSNCLDELLDGSVGLLDAFGMTRELVSQIKDHTRCIQSVIRRRSPDPNDVQRVISDSMGLRKKLRKDVKRVTVGLKRIEGKFVEASPATDESDHHYSYSVMAVLREVNAMSASILQALLSKLDVQASNKKSKWSIISKLVHKGTTTSCEDEKQEFGNEFDAVLCLSKQFSLEKAKILQNHLWNLEMGMCQIEDDLDGLYRRLIRTRTSLLNIFSQ